MGFLDLLSGKKKESNSSHVPPPAPGPNKMGVPNLDESKHLDGKEDSKNKLPPPLGASENNNSNNLPVDPSKPEAPKPEEKQMPNLEPPKPVVNTGLEPPIPRGVNSQQENNHKNNEMKQFSEDFDFPKLELPKFPGTEDFSDSNDDKNEGFQKQTENQEQKVQSNTSLSMEKQIPQKSYSPVRSYLSENEMQLNNLKEELHRPQKIEGSDSSNIGNVESTLRSKTKNVKGPLFIEINNYKRVLHSLDEMKKDLSESQEFVLKLDEFNDKKYNEFERWRKSIEYIHSKLAFVDKTLFKE